MSEHKSVSEWCEGCHGPVQGYTALQRFGHWLAYLLIVHLVPVRHMMRRPFVWALPYCGCHAYACVCADKNALAREASK